MDKRDDDLFGFEDEPASPPGQESEEVLTIDSFDEEDFQDSPAEIFDMAEEPLTEDGGETDLTAGDDDLSAAVAAAEDDTPGWARVTDATSASADENPGTFDDALVEEPPVKNETAEPVAAEGRSRRFLLLVLLLVLIAAGGAWLLLPKPQEEPTPAAVSGRMPIQPPPVTPAQQEPVKVEQVVPKAVASAKPAPGSESSAENGSPAGAVPQPPETTESKADGGSSPGKNPDKGSVAVETKQLTPQSPVEKKQSVAAGNQPQVSEPTSQAASRKPQVKAPGQPPRGTGGYLVRVGSFILPANFEGALKTVRKLGFEPIIDEVSVTRPMIRLRYGVFDKETAPAILAKLKKRAPAAFVVYNQGKGEIYAGSFVSLDKARRYADILWEKHQLRLEEVRADVAVPMRRVSVGPFADGSEAREAAKKLKKAGLEGAIVKNGA